jgi:hypothetical protein
MRELVARGIKNHGARLLVASLLGPPATTPRLAGHAAAIICVVGLRDCHAAPSNSSCHRAMLLHDVCHPIDSPNMRFILENVKFPN